MFSQATPTPAPPAYRWTPAAQRHFLAALARTGSVQRACDAVSKSRGSAYAMRRRSDAGLFRVGWDAACLIAQEFVGEDILVHAMTGISYSGYRHPESRRWMWRRDEPLLGRGYGLALLKRMDDAAARVTRDPIRLARATAAVASFADLLDAIGAGADEQPFMCVLAQNSADFAPTGAQQIGWVTR